MAKRKKRADKAEPETGAKNSEERITEDQNLDFVNGDSQHSKKREKKKNKKAKESSTVSIAIAGSIIHNAQSLELAPRLAGQIARAATIFRIDEGMLPPLDAPHHLRKHEWAPYREGITLKEKATNSSATEVGVGLSKNVMVEQELEPGMRVTVAMGTNHNLDSGNKLTLPV
ncbi:hypothetical protein SLEP1_g46437 [Rubroshorea leprosula]|uniref:Uncharacterized protein n=1 Tax=Rubroshorea leprosula TaxID=152421 RepID=A0AAV5LPV2_9ROSI|nr:hypothetical protein SLEP1_g46437 [Rubroshorea leprosula]